jgi:hypothetical protein
VALFGRRGRASTADRRDRSADAEHLEQFARSRGGVEAYLEPRTTVTENTVILIAADGEWTRRRVSSPVAARQWAHRLGVPFYDVHLTGYPQRMRDYNARRKAADR